MLCVISPAKSLDFTTPAPTTTHTQPALLPMSQPLVDILQSYSPADIAALMKISDKLAALNVARYAQWQTPFRLGDDEHPAKQALFAFTGDVYAGMDPQTFDDDTLAAAQQQLRILSGLYGVLRPLDLIMPYRLEMGIRLANAAGSTLYDYWCETITDTLSRTLQETDAKVLVNLASNEYFKAVDVKRVACRIITPVFKDEKNGQFKIISFHAKKARGAMAAWIVRHGLHDPEQLKAFEGMGYRYSSAHSSGDTWVFTR